MRQQTVQIVHARKHLTIEFEQDIAHGETGFCGGAALDHFRHHDRGSARMAQATRETPIQHHGFGGDSDTRPSDAAVAHQARRNILCGVAADRETDALCGPCHRGVDADDEPSPIDQRAAGIPGIERRVRLNHAFDQAPRPCPQAYGRAH